jgi:signal transduction histidine kinase
VQRALAGAERAATLTHQLLAYARRQPLLPAVVDLNALVGQTVELLHRSLGEAVAIETALAPGLRRTRIDPGQLSSALLNLAVNARDAMPKGGTLRISTRNLAPAETAEAAPDLGPVACVLIEVGDSGAGMPPEVLEHAFEPFYTTKPLGQGSGLGLSQVYGFVKQSNGHVALDSVPGRGTRVHLYLPAVVETSPPGPAIAGSGAVALNAGYRGTAE